MSKDITVDLTSKDFEEVRQSEGEQSNSTQYANAPIEPKETKLVIQETQIRQVTRTHVDIQKWRDAHITAESRYFPNRTWLYDLYDDILLDGHLSGVIAKRIDTVLNKEIFFEKGNKRVPEVDKLVNSIQFRNVCRWILETQLWGISGIEFEPGPEFMPRMIPRKHIKPKWQIISYEQTGSEGISYVDAANLFIIGEPEDLGLLLKAAPYVIYKRNGFADWGQFIEIFGQPIRIMYYDAYDPQARIELKRTLDESGGSMALMIPKGVEFDIKDGKQSNGNGELQEKFKDSLNQEMSIIVLSNTETTTNGKTGSQAKSKVHKDQQDEISKSDLFYLTAYLNSPQFLQILASYGYPVEGGKFSHSLEISIEYLEKRMSIDIQMPEDLPISDDYWYSTYGIEKPEDYDAMKAALLEKQKQTKEAETIAADPKNKPSKKALKNALKELQSPDTNNKSKPFIRKWRALRNALSDFFA